MNITSVIRQLVPAKYRPYQLLSRLAWHSTQGRIAAGPFQGMEYLSEAANSALVPKLLGIYEFELAPIVKQLATAGLTRVVDIGCAEGYYAVGFARCCPGVDIIAFDIDHNARQLAANLARKNRVGERVVVEGECTPDRLQSMLEGHRAAVICDIEGAEATILDPQRVPALRIARMLVEVHDQIAPDSGKKLKQRFSSTHRIETIAAIPRTREHCPRFHPLLAFAPRDTVVSLIVERPDESQMYWLSFEPIQSYEESVQ